MADFSLLIFIDRQRSRSCSLGSEWSRHGIHWCGYIPVQTGEWSLHCTEYVQLLIGCLNKWVTVTQCARLTGVSECADGVFSSF